MKKTFQTLLCAALAWIGTAGCGQAQPAGNTTAGNNENLPKVYFYKEINAGNLEAVLISFDKFVKHDLD